MIFNLWQNKFKAKIVNAKNWLSFKSIIHGVVGNAMVENMRDSLACITWERQEEMMVLLSLHIALRLFSRNTPLGTSITCRISLPFVGIPFVYRVSQNKISILFIWETSKYQQFFNYKTSEKKTLFDGDTFFKIKFSRNFKWSFFYLKLCYTDI